MGLDSHLTQVWVFVPLYAIGEVLKNNIVSGCGRPYSTHLKNTFPLYDHALEDARPAFDKSDSKYWGVS